MRLEAVTENLEALKVQLEELLAASIIQFDKHCRRNLPERPGVYRIFDRSQPEETVRAGRTDFTLRQRVYQNHFMGDQTGNLRAQLVKAGDCVDLNAAKEFMRQGLAVQVLPIDEQRQRAWLEHFILAVLRPRFGDRSQG
jgi:hypothetical protein